MKSYRVKQKQQTECAEPSGYKTTKNGRSMHFCTCAECGRKINKFVKKQTGGENPLGKAFKAAKWAEKITRKVIPSTNHVFDRYWSGDIAKNAFTGKTGITSKKFWTHPRKKTVIHLIKNPKTGKYENVYMEP